jgi:hypothetical protein
MESRDFTKLYEPLADKISRQLGLVFIPPDAPGGNVCFMSNPGLRLEFKTTFTQPDVINFVYGVLNSSPDREDFPDIDKIDFSQFWCPRDLETFWELVRLGVVLRQPASPD